MKIRQPDTSDICEICPDCRGHRPGSGQETHNERNPRCRWCDGYSAALYDLIELRRAAHAAGGTA